MGEDVAELSDWVMSEVRRRKCRVETNAGTGGRGCLADERKFVRYADEIGKIITVYQASRDLCGSC